MTGAATLATSIYCAVFRCRAPPRGQFPLLAGNAGCCRAVSRAAAASRCHGRARPRETAEVSLPRSADSFAGVLEEAGACEPGTGMVQGRAVALTRGLRLRRRIPERRDPAGAANSCAAVPWPAALLPPRLSQRIPRLRHSGRRDAVGVRAPPVEWHTRAWPAGLSTRFRRELAQRRCALSGDGVAASSLGTRPRVGVAPVGCSRDLVVAVRARPPFLPAPIPAPGVRAASPMREWLMPRAVVPEPATSFPHTLVNSNFWLLCLRSRHLHQQLHCVGVENDSNLIDVERLSFPKRYPQRCGREWRSKYIGLWKLQVLLEARRLLVRRSPPGLAEGRSLKNRRSRGALAPRARKPLQNCRRRMPPRF